jgi:hypothetical protein
MPRYACFQRNDDVLLWFQWLGRGFPYRLSTQVGQILLMLDLRGKRFILRYQRIHPSAIASSTTQLLQLSPNPQQNIIIREDHFGNVVVLIHSLCITVSYASFERIGLQLMPGYMLPPTPRVCQSYSSISISSTPLDWPFCREFDFGTEASLSIICRETETMLSSMSCWPRSEMSGIFC